MCISMQILWNTRHSFYSLCGTNSPKSQNAPLFGSRQIIVHKQKMVRKEMTAGDDFFSSCARVHSVNIWIPKLLQRLKKSSCLYPDKLGTLSSRKQRTSNKTRCNSPWWQFHITSFYNFADFFFPPKSQREKIKSFPALVTLGNLLL